MTACVSNIVVDLGRIDRFDIGWPISGQSDAAVAEIDLEDSGVWWPLTIVDGYAVGYFAGPDFVSPAPAHPVPATSHAMIRVTDGRITVIVDAGFIRIV